MARLHQTFLQVTDVDATVSCYEDVFGLAVAERSESKATFRTGECELVVQQEFDAETLSAYGMTPPGPDRGDGVVVVLEVADVDAVHERAVDHGATVLAEPREVEWGRKLCLIADPDGYVFELSRPLESAD